jgi:hypothetical protein
MWVNNKFNYNNTSLSGDSYLPKKVTKHLHILLQSISYLLIIFSLTDDYLIKVSRCQTRTMGSLNFSIVMWSSSSWFEHKYYVSCCCCLVNNCTECFKLSLHFLNSSNFFFLWYQPLTLNVHKCRIHQFII